MNAIKLKNVYRSYDDFKLDNLFFNLPMGCILGLNGIPILGSLKTMSVIANILFVIALPFYFRFDSHIGRIAYYISLGAVVALAMAVQFSMSGDINLLSIDYSLVLALIGIVAFIVSYFVSVSFYSVRLNKLK